MIAELSIGLVIDIAEGFAVPNEKDAHEPSLLLQFAFHHMGVHGGCNAAADGSSRFGPSIAPLTGKVA
ncbi:hypothetical protein thsrh120_27000 [Rhizobium sp. No.120]